MVGGSERIVVQHLGDCEPRVGELRSTLWKCTEVGEGEAKILNDGYMDVLGANPGLFVILEDKIVKERQIR